MALQLWTLAILCTALGRTSCFVLFGSDAKPWENTSLPLEARASALLDQLSLEEKLGLLDADKPPTGAIPRLDIPAFEGWNECLHGVVDDNANPKAATSFPVPMSLAASFSASLAHRVGSAIGREARAMYNLQRQEDGTIRHLNCFSPNINLVRDPRWGRNSETLGEDPWLTGKLAAAYVQGLQGNHSHLLQVVATCKHFAAYSLEASEGYTRQSFDARVDARDLEETYLPAFQACVQQGQAASVMCSYNALNGTPACASGPLLQKVLRERWGFKGFVASDCGAVEALFYPHDFTNSTNEAAAATLLAGTDMDCPSYKALKGALQQNLVADKDVTLAARRVLEARFRLGVFDPPASSPWAGLGAADLGTPEHKALANEVAARGTVLLKNEPGEDGSPTLPLDPASLKKVLVVGPHASSKEQLLGSYYGTPAGGVTSFAEAFQAALGSDKVEVQQGAYVTGRGADFEIDIAVRSCRAADVCILMLGLSTNNPRVTSQGGQDLWNPYQEQEGYDRSTLELPGLQEVLARNLAGRTTTPLIAVLVHGGPLDVSWLQDSSRIGAILTAWYPAQGVAGVVDIMLGKRAPTGRSPVSWPFQNYTRQIAMSDMGMRHWPGRTHRFLQVPTLYSFGHGLSYGSLKRSLGTASLLLKGDKAALQVTAAVTNTGNAAVEETLLLRLGWAEAEDGQASRPVHALGDVQQVQLEPGQQRIVSLKASLAGVPDTVQQLQYCLDSACSSLSLAARLAGRAAAVA